MLKKQVIKNYFPALVLFLTLSSFTFYAYYELKSALRIRTEKLFEQRVSRIREALNKKISDYIQILKGCQALIYASDGIDNKRWKIYVDNLNLSENYPGIQAIGFAAMIDKSQISPLERKIQANGYPGFKILSNFKSERLAPIIYIEPFTGRNLRAFGFDMYSENTRRDAMNRAMITGQPALTSKVTLIQETDQDVQPGFLLYLAVYNSPQTDTTKRTRSDNIQGFVYNPFRAHDFMNATLGNYSDIHISVYNGRTAVKENLLYTSRATPIAGFAENRTLQSDSIISIAGTEWRIIASPTQNFGSSIEKREPALVLLFGLTITVLMSLISVNIIKNKSRVSEELRLSKELEKRKDEFIGIAAHELKTPLTSINAYTQLLERISLKESEKKLLTKTRAQIKKLSLLISDLLDMSKINAGALQFNISEFSLKQLISESIESVSHLYQSHQFILTNPIPDIQLKGDHSRLEQAITNLLLNAVKYSPAADKVYLNVKHTQSFITIEVRDTGIGISEVDRNHIFDKFYRAEGLSPYLSGLGMGLYIANEIVNRHGGSITVSSEPGKGSVFSIHLPANAASAAL